MNHLQLVQEADQLLQTNKQRPLIGQHCVIESLFQNKLLTAHLIGRKAAQSDQESTIDRVQLYKLMDKHLGDEDLKNTFFTLDIKYHSIPGDTKPAKIRELILHLQRRERLVELLTHCQQEHPHVTWPTLTITQPNELIPRLDTAVVVDIARPALHNVAQYLDEEEREANFILLRHAENRFLNQNDDWSIMIRGFAVAMNKFSHRLVGSHAHFFLAGPGAMLFGMGCIWGTVDEAAVYHYENGTYHHVYDWKPK